MACVLKPSAPQMPSAPATRLRVLACSPRAGGNSDTAAGLVAAAGRAAGCAVEELFLREFTVRPCVSCGHCLKRPGQCPLDAGDDAGRLFTALHDAGKLVIVAPVYFYGPPAGLKALVDRAQRFWATGPAAGPARDPGESLAGDSADAPAARPAAIALCAGRTSGERLFEPSLLILRCFLRALGREASPPLLIRGVDDRDALAGNPALIRQAAEWSRDFLRPDAIGPNGANDAGNAGDFSRSRAPMDSPCR